MNQEKRKDVREDVMEKVHFSMMDIIGYAEELEEAGYNAEAEGLREISGQINEWICNEVRRIRGLPTRGKNQ